jgi:ankyrin repeat protein
MSIWRAASEGDVGEVERLVGRDPRLLNAKKDGTGWTPLMSACIEGRVEVVRWLVEHGAAMNERYGVGCTALLLACTKSPIPLLRLLVEKGADPSAATGTGLTLLMDASSQGHVEVVRWLLGHTSAEATIIRRECDGRTALCVRLLLRLWGGCEGPA